MDQTAELSRMKWAARRGMLELDLVLEPFVTEQYLSLSEREKQQFQELMLCEDQEMFGWFLRREQPEREDLRAIVAKILDYAQRPR
ncbi:MAG: hypothetical protein CSA53_07640 [Gammaproteobacteria bacterium]|nr:MAG: hypothetical protein CSA53_07640 [Gammaproteobacteria bacterium]